MRPRKNQSPPARGNDSQRGLVERVRRALEANLDGPVTLARLSRQVGMSPYHLQRTFKRWVGITPRQYQDALRLHGLKARLRQ